MRWQRGRAVALLAAVGAALPLAGCAAIGRVAGSDVEQVVVGYQSTNLATVTSGALLRAQGFFERRLAEVSERSGKRYTVRWLDHDADAPIEERMLAGKVDIGAMADEPLRRAGAPGEQVEPRTRLLAVTGYEPRGALTMVVTSPRSPARSLGDLAGTTVSTTVGSAAHAALLRALRTRKPDPLARLTITDQPPAAGAAALQAGSVGALAQSGVWPALLVHRGRARLVYDGADPRVPALYGVFVPEAYASRNPDVVSAFLRAQFDSTRYLRENPVAAAKLVADVTGLPPEVVYLFTGRGGLVTFGPTPQPSLPDVLDARDGVDATDLAATGSPPVVTGTDPVCGQPVTDPARAGEVWPAGEDRTQPAATPTCLLRAVRLAQEAGNAPRAAYVPDAVTGLRWFADRSAWVRDPAAPAAARFKPFATIAGARAYVARHPGSRWVSYPRAVAEAGR